MKNKRLWLMVIAIAAVILAVGGWVYYLWTTPARTVVDQTCSGMLLFSEGREPVPCEVRLTGNYFHYRLGNEGDSFDGGYDGGVIADGVPLLDYLYACFKTDYAFINGQQQQDVAISKDLDLIAAEVNYDTEQEMVVPFGSGEDCLLVAPASSREEAEALLTRLRDYCQSIDKEIDWCDPYLRIDGSPASGEQSADIDGAYYIEEFFADGIAVRAAESSQRQRLYFREDFWEDGELFLAAYGLEPLIDMPVQCTYEELQEQWTSDQVYHVFGPDGKVTMIRQTGEDQSFSYLNDDELGQAIYTAEETETDGELLVTPVRYIPQEELEEVSRMESRPIEVSVEHGDGLIFYPERQSTVSMQEDTRCYVCTATEVYRADMEEVLERMNGTVVRLLLEGDAVVCAVVYDIY